MHVLLVHTEIDHLTTNPVNFFRSCISKKAKPNAFSNLLEHFKVPVSLKYDHQTGATWRIIPVRKWLVTPIYVHYKPWEGHLEGEQPYVWDLLTMVICHLLTGMILQARYSWWPHSPLHSWSPNLNKFNPWPFWMITLQGTITYPTWGKGKSSSKMPWHGNNHVSSQEGNTLDSKTN